MVEIRSTPPAGASRGSRSRYVREWNRLNHVRTLACVIAAGLYGGATASRKILWVQALPAAIALAVVWI